MFINLKPFDFLICKSLISCLQINAVECDSMNNKLTILSIILVIRQFSNSVCNKCLLIHSFHFCFSKDPGRDFISIKFYDRKSGEFHVDMVPALSGKSLR